MAAQARRVRMEARTARSEASRPQLRVISHSNTEHARIRAAQPAAASWLQRHITARMAQWIAVATVAAISFLGVLGMRVMLVENSFEAAQTQQKVTLLSQDVEQEQARLDKLQSSLPDRAQKLGMTTSNNSVTVNMSGTGQ